MLFEILRFTQSSQSTAKTAKKQEAEFLTWQGTCLEWRGRITLIGRAF